MPQPRPALRRAPDADVHPALVIPLQTGLRSSPEPEPVVLAPPATAPETLPAPQEPVRKAAKKDKKVKAKKGKKAKKAQQRPQRAMGAVPTNRFQGPGRATSDAVLFEPDRRVPLSVLVPKAVRDEIRDIARLSGSTQDQLVSELLSAGLSDPRRW